jgi:hypothetical protein
LSQPIPAIDETEFPPALWRRSGRPLRGQFIRGYVVITTIVGAMLFLSAPVSWIVSGVALVAGLAMPYAVELYLARWERRVRAADKREANTVLEQLRANPWIKHLAPHGWLALQEGVLQMHRHDGRAAARCFEQALRLAGKAPDPKALISAQAHALVLAGDRKPARELLQGLTDEALSTRDRLDLGLLLLQESGANREALQYLEQAHDDLGDHPRVLAGLALAERKVGAEDRAYAHFVAADEALEEADDPLAADVLKRARKALRARIKQEQKRARDLAKKAGAEDEEASPARAQPREKKGKRKKDKKKRDKRKKDKKRDKRKKDKKRDKRKKDQKRTTDANPPKTQSAAKSSQPPKPSPRPLVAPPKAVLPKLAPLAPKAAAPKAAPPKVAAPKAAPPKAAAPKSGSSGATPPKAPLFAPSGASKPAATNSPLFAPPKPKSGALPPPPVVPPPPKLGAPPKLGGLGGPPKVTPKAAPKMGVAKPAPPAISDDGWGDAFGDEAPPPPVAPTKPVDEK